MEFKKFHQQHLNSVAELSDAALGKNYLSLNYLKKYIDTTNLFGFVLEKDNTIIGFTLIDILSPTQIKKHVLKDKYWFYNQVKPYQKVALRKQTVIATGYANKGLGSLLVEHSIKVINLITPIQMSSVWKKDKSNPMASLLRKNGFSLVKTFPNYWNEDSLIKNYNCSICGVPPCKCTAEVYIKKKH